MILDYLICKFFVQIAYAKLIVRFKGGPSFFPPQKVFRINLIMQI